VRYLTLFATITLFASAATVASTDRYTATLVQPLGNKKEFIAEHNAWTCEGSACVLVSTPTDADSVTSCRRLMKQVGPVAAYGRPGNLFDAKKLAACNGTA
jgi:hypothetical protein